MVKSGLEKNIFEISPCVKPFLGLKRSFLDKREDLCPELQIQSQNWPCLHMEGFQKKSFCGIFVYGKWNFKSKITSIFDFEFVNKVWISGVLDIFCWVRSEISYLLVGFC